MCVPRGLATHVVIVPRIIRRKESDEVVLLNTKVYLVSDG